MNLLLVNMPTSDTAYLQQYLCSSFWHTNIINLEPILSQGLAGSTIILVKYKDKIRVLQFSVTSRIPQEWSLLLRPLEGY